MELSTFALFKKMNSASGEYIIVEGETLKRYQEVLLSMAEDVIRVFEENGLFYQLSGGTALGALRHGGFIPWDDDFDLNMLYDDLPRLKKLLNKAYPGKYTVQTPRDEDYGLTLGKIRLNNSISLSREDADVKHAGFAIDLFFIENVPDAKPLRLIHGTLCMGAGFLLSCRMFYRNRKDLRRMEKENPKAKPLFETKILIGAFLQGFSVRQMSVFASSCYHLCREKHSRQVSIPAGRGHYFREIYNRSDMMRCRRLPFEGHSWKAAGGIRRYMRILYGKDYMVLPPEEKREKHMLRKLVFPEDMPEQ